MKRILAILDLRKAPWTLGRVLNFQEEALVHREECEADKIDIVFFYDQLKRFDITTDNYRFYLSKLFPMAFVNRHLGSFMFIDSFAALYIISFNYYHVFPSMTKLIKRKDTYKGSFNKVLDFYNREGFIPQLSCSKAMVMWACSFIEKEVRPYSPIVVHLRNCSVPFSDGIERNALLDEWLSFFKFCTKSVYRNIQFIIIGTLQEIDPRFRALKNVIFSKDYGTTAEQDCALIQTSVMYMGVNSGPTIMARYCGVPYIHFEAFEPSHHDAPPKGEQLPYATPLQRMVWRRGTKEVIAKNFVEIFNQIDVSEWKRQFDNMDISKLDRKKNAKWPSEI